MAHASNLQHQINSQVQEQPVVNANAYNNLVSDYNNLLNKFN